MSDYYLQKVLKSNAVYIANYFKLYQILDKYGIPLVAAQYPMRSVAPLEHIFASKKVYLVDNESLFKDPIAEFGYETFFIDYFAGDFGHCTAEGNKLLAENIKDVILQNWDEISSSN